MSPYAPVFREQGNLVMATDSEAGDYRAHDLRVRAGVVLHPIFESEDRLARS
jgi:hypothetical protein